MVDEFIQWLSAQNWKVIPAETATPIPEDVLSRYGHAIPQSCSDEARREVAGEKARLAIVGTGSRGQYHIQNLLNTPEAEIVALCDIYPPHLAEAAALCPGAKCYSDFDELLKDTNVQGPFNRKGSPTSR